MLNFKQAQFFCFQARALRAQAEIVTGAYKNVKLVKHDGTPLTDSEKLQEKIDEMNRHISHMQAQAENLDE